MKTRSNFSNPAGATLAETLVAMVVSMYMFIAILTGTIALNQIFNGAINYSSGTTDQQRAMDFIARDVRRAISAPSITGTAPNQTLTLTLPDCYSSYDSNGNPAHNSLVAPTISSSSKVYYNNNNTITVSYSINSSGQLQRQQTINSTNSTTYLVIANSVHGLTSSFQNPVNLNSIVTFSITFSPFMTTHDSTSTATTLTATTSIRHIN